MVNLKKWIAEALCRNNWKRPVLYNLLLQEAKQFSHGDAQLHFETNEPTDQQTTSKGMEN